MRGVTPARSVFRSYEEIFMADVANRYSGNAFGPYYVDNQCIDCDLCRQTAPNNFARDEKSGHSFVFQQPRSDQEVAECQEAMQNCPVEAIGGDGLLVKALDAEKVAC
jgi:ferredoxin